MKSMRIINYLKLEYFLISLIFCIFVISFFFYNPAEDAVMLYEYSKNFFDKKIITYSDNAEPTEGATDFLWMIIISFSNYLFPNEYFSALFLNFLSIILLLAIFDNQKYKKILLLFLILTPFMYSSILGFSTLFFTTCYVISIRLYLKNSKYLYLSLLILSLVRPDGVVYGFALIAAKIFKVRMNFKKELKYFFTFLIIPGLIYFISRYLYFDNFLPLPFIVKSEEITDYLFFYKNSILSGVSFFISYFIIIILTKFNKKFFSETLIIFLIPLFFYLTINTTQNVGNRFFSPLVFGFIYFLISNLENLKFNNTKYAIIFMLSITILEIKTTSSTLLTLIDTKYENFYKLSKQISDYKGKLLTTEAGKIAYYTNMTVDDAYGLHNKYFAKNIVNEAFLKKRDYDVFVLHCNLVYFKRKNSYGKDKNWATICNNIIKYLQDNELLYDFYLLKFYSYSNKDNLKNTILKFFNKFINEKCSRHDTVVIKKKFENYQDIKNELLSLGAIEFPYKTLDNPKDDLYCYN
jgi:hypothetical protein